jgi:hypothetical protein
MGIADGNIIETTGDDMFSEDQKMRSHPKADSPTRKKTPLRCLTIAVVCIVTKDYTQVSSSRRN